MKLPKFIVCTLLLCVSIWVFNSASAEDQRLPRDQSSILIYSFSHGPETETQKAQGNLNIGISSFESITGISINGKDIDFNKDTKVDINFPFNLNSGRNEFLVVVRTQNIVQQKKFMIHYGIKKKPKKSALQLIGLIGNSYLDNVSSATDGGMEKSGSKISLTLIPMVSLYSDTLSELKVKGILLREKFSAKAFSSNEVSYSKIAIEWKNKETFLGEIRAESGINDVRTNNENPLLGQDESVTEYYISSMLAWKLNQAYKWDLKLEYKFKDAKAETTDPDIDADAAVSEMNTQLHFKSSGFKGTGKLGYKENDAKGKYKDSSTINIGIKTLFPFELYTPGLSYDYKQTAMKIPNPLIGGIKEEKTMSVVTLKLGYQIFKTGNLTFKLKYKQQTANIETAEYGANETVLSYTHIF